MRKILIIGGSGFVGSRLLSEVDRDNFINLDKNPSPFFDNITINGDIRNLDEIKIPKGTQSVVLLAAEHRDDVSPPSLYYDVNVEGTRNVLEAMDSAGIKNLIFTSSVAVYGLNKENPDENHPVDPFNHYGKSKWEAEKVIKKWYSDRPDGKSVTIIRPTVIFGERNRGNVFNLLKQIASGRFLMVGKGINKKSMAYVGNVVAFIKSRVEVNQIGYEVYNYVDKPDFNMMELVEQVKKSLSKKMISIKIPYALGMIIGYGFDFLSFMSGKKLSISSVRIKKFCATTQFDATKCHKVFNSPHTLSEGLDHTLKHEFLKKSTDHH